MTEQMRQHIACPYCGKSIPTQDDFSEWIRNCKELDSRFIGIGVSDIDLIIHRFKFDNDRSYQCIMLVEKKSHGASPKLSQRDTINIFGQFMRNDKKTFFKGRRAQAENRPCKVYSSANKKRITVKAFGYHLLQFEKTDPDNSLWIKWDKKEISKQQLIQLLRFDISPETLLSLDGRKHHKKNPYFWDK